ncbi:hypothetical protein F943_02291 [Acinetobacter ursingii NIPH 706]|nr:hypothetical protein F943_02291 [Acinetobacter ursingii NIPH 706]EXD37894.1 hypothetical protein J500_0355 [Acinetobacter sp. 479375]
MMTLDQSTLLYASVLRQLLPVGGYDTSANTNIAIDIYAHAKLLAQTDFDGKRLLSVIHDIPPELISEYEREYGLPLNCSFDDDRSIEERINIVKWVRSHIFGTEYYRQLLSFFGVELINLVKPKPMQCTDPCTAPVNTEQLRYKIKLLVKNSNTANMSCIIESYFPAFLQIDPVEA